jgi:hypothetical protein
VIGAVVTVLILVAAFLIFNRVERFLINDPRFALNGPEGAAETPTLEVAGAAHASHRAIQAVFAGDSGRSVYMLPLADRRIALRTVDWVKDVSIARIWPNRIVVRILERKPVAFVATAANRFGLIDADGVILPPAADRFTFPVLSGVRVTDKIEERRDRVQRMLRLTVLHADGTPVGLPASLTRNLLRAVDFLPFFYGFGLAAMVLSRDFQRLGDIAAGTVVAYRETDFQHSAVPPAPPLPPPMPLTAMEQRTVLDLAARSQMLTAERAQELAALAPRVTGGREGSAALGRILSIANYLIGRRAQ